MCLRCKKKSVLTVQDFFGNSKDFCLDCYMLFLQEVATGDSGRKTCQFPGNRRGDTRKEEAHNPHPGVLRLFQEGG